MINPLVPNDSTPPNPLLRGLASSLYSEHSRGVVYPASGPEDKQISSFKFTRQQHLELICSPAFPIFASIPMCDQGLQNHSTPSRCLKRKLAK
ncbi:hypothetical protein EVAR_73230_1, partial [Eumeta japonica]